jgi:hypothetical protein
MSRGLPVCIARAIARGRRRELKRLGLTRRNVNDTVRFASHPSCILAAR